MIENVNHDWLFNDEIFIDIPEGVICFVYMITKRYIGKKKFYFSKIKVVKGKRKKYKAESDWKSYYGSNDELKNDVVLLGPGSFKREILKLCTMQSESSYYEAKFQFEYDVLLYPLQFYNSWTSVKITRKHLVRFHR